MGAVRVAGKVGKAMVLVGKKDQAREMLEKVGSASERAVPPQVNVVPDTESVL